MMTSKITQISLTWEALLIKPIKEKIGIMEIALKELVLRKLVLPNKQFLETSSTEM